MFNRKLKKRVEWLENEMNYINDLKAFKIENKKRKKGNKLRLFPINRNKIGFKIESNN